jgi:hypothetical protein
MTTKLEILTVVLLVGCGGSHVRPDDLSAEGHRSAAAKEQAEAEAHRKLYDPQAYVTHSVSGRAAVATPADATYNPTAGHLEEAERLSAHARAHRDAAAALESFEAMECRGFQPKVRAACPVAGPIARVEDIDHGVRLVLVDGAPVADVVAHMRCHFAFARTRGFEKMEGCPMYVKGIAIMGSADGRAIEVTSRDDATVSELRRRSHEEGGGQAANAT